MTTIPDLFQGRALMAPPRLPLREYQAQAIEAVRLAFQTRNVRRQLLCLPTGAGKTVVFSHLLRRRRASGRALVLAHRYELLKQARSKIQQVTPDLSVGLVKAEKDEHEGVEVVVASVQTLANPKRLARIGQFSTVVIDEAHHAAAPTYVRILEELGCLGDNGPLTVGVTATPGRGDGLGLDIVFDEITFSRGILFMILNGFLVDVEAIEIETSLDYSKVTKSAGDYTDSSLGQALDESGAIEAAALAYGEHARDRRGVAFTPTIATADALATLMRGLGIPAEFISGETPGAERERILRRVATGEIQVIANAAVLTEGFDQPELSAVLVARPTRSQGNFAQMVGRVLRPHISKPEKALVLTMSAPPEEGLVTIADLAGEESIEVRSGESLAEAAVRTQQEKRAFGGFGGSGLRINARQLDLFARSQLRWLPVDSGFTLPIKGGMVILVPEPEGTWRVVESRDGHVSTIQGGLDLGYATGLGEEQARSSGAIARADAGWRAAPVTRPQLDTLAKMRLPSADTRGAASDAIAVASSRRVISKLVAGGTR